jgi:ABC-type hemin transport system ATPase subunit
VVALEACDVSYRRCGLTLVQRVSLCADRGEVLALLGAPGSGVNTLLLLLAGVLPPDAGRVLIDGVVPTTPRWDLGPDPRRLAHGPDQARVALATHATGGITLLDRPTVGLDAGDATDMLPACRRRAADGECVVVTTDDAGLVASYADTVAVIVAGRLLSWGVPGVALVPALQILRVGATGRGASGLGMASRSPSIHASTGCAVERAG